MKRFLAFILCLMMLISSMVIVNAEEPETTETNNDQIVVAYFNASAGPGTKDFTNIDVLNYHPAHIEASAFGYTAGNPIITHNYSKNLDMWKEKAYAKNPDIKFVFTVANGNISTFESWFTSLDRTKILVKEMLSIIETYGFDGLDIDYEFPQGGNNPKRYYVEFMKRMREGLDELSAKNGKEYILSMAVPAGTWAFSLFNMPELAKYVSYFNIMSYDLHVGSATKGITHHHTNPCADPTPGFEGGSVEEDIALYREMGIPDDKIVVGIGMYARRWTNVPNVNNGLYQSGTLDETSNEAYLHYSIIKSGYENKQGYVKYWDDVAKAPYLYNASKGVFLTYDDEQSAEIKCQLAVTEGVRGVMVFDYVTTDSIGFFDKVQTWLDKYMHEHSYTSEVTTEATCGADGVMTYSCECGDSYTEAIPATGEHSYGDWSVVKAATYLETGMEERICSVCSLSDKREIPVLEYVNPFIDVKESHWFYDAVEYCVKKGFVTGMTENTFVPNNNLTRAQFLTILANYDGVDLTAYEGRDAGFEDVKPAHWWNEAICWAVERGYTAGVSETAFGPNNNITREQLTRFFYVYSEKNFYNVSERADLSAYTDADKIGSWARENVEWAVAKGLISGTSETELSPRGNATRAQAARIIMLYNELGLEPDLDSVFSPYPGLMMFLGTFDSVDNIHKLTLLNWAKDNTERISFSADEEKLIYTHVYSASKINDFVDRYFDITLDLASLAGKKIDGMYDIVYDEAADTVTFIYYGGYGYGGPPPEYQGYEQISETQYRINYNDIDPYRDCYIIAEYRDGRFVILSNQVA